MKARIKKAVKSMVAISMSAMMLLSAVACGGEEGSGETNKLTISYMSGTENLVMSTRLANAFEAKKKAEGVDVTVESVEVGSGGYNQDLLKKIASNTMPDIVYTNDTLAQQWFDKGVFETLDEHLDSLKIDFSIYDENAFESAKTYDGKIAYIPRSYDQPVIFINVDYFNKYNIQVPANDADWTWTKLYNTMTALKTNITTQEGDRKAEQHRPLDINFSWAPIYNAFIRSFGGYVYNPEDGTVGMTSAGSINAIRKIREMADDGLISSSTEGAGVYFSNGKAAMYVASRPYAAELENNGITNVAFLPMPKMDSAFCGLTNPVSYYSHGTNGYALYSKSTNKSLAIEYLNFLLSEEAQNIDSAKGMSVPIIKSLQTADSAVWKTGVECLKTVNQNAFLEQSGYEYILTVYARNNRGVMEYNIYSQMTTMMNAVNAATYASAEAFCSATQAQVERWI